jgi:16S rRNA (guanine527-N7)-methyltransferase
MQPDLTAPKPTEQEMQSALGLGVSRESWSRIGDYVALLCRWQQRTNLISPASLPYLWTRHVLDSLQLLPMMPRGTTRVADLGSGGGFPAIPLAIASGAEFHLYESIGKKAAFLREAARITGCNVHVHPHRLEELANAGDLPKVDLVTARALASLEELLVLAEPFLKTGAKALFHKGQDCDAELTRANKYWKIKAERHSSMTDSFGVILEVSEASRV